MSDENNNQTNNEIVRAINSLKEEIFNKKEQEKKEQEDLSIIQTLTTGFNDLKELLTPKIEEVIEDEKIEVPEIPKIPEQEQKTENSLTKIIRRILIG